MEDRAVRRIATRRGADPPFPDRSRSASRLSVAHRTIPAGHQTSPTHAHAARDDRPRKDGRQHGRAGAARLGRCVRPRSGVVTKYRSSAPRRRRTSPTSCGARDAARSWIMVPRARRSIDARRADAGPHAGDIVIDGATRSTPTPWRAPSGRRRRDPLHRLRDERRDLGARQRLLPHGPRRAKRSRTVPIFSRSRRRRVRACRPRARALRGWCTTARVRAA